MSGAGAALPLGGELFVLHSRRRPTADWISRGIALALALAVAAQLKHAGLGLIDAVLPANPLFWICLVAVYFALPVADWTIFQRLWSLPLFGFPVLLRKRVTNELLFSYSGEAYFYLWARQKTGLTTAPFGTVKDVNILSALAANLLTLLLVAASLPFSDVLAGVAARGGLLSAGAILLVSLLFLLLGQRLFTLSRQDLVWVFKIHMVRLVATNLLLALAWHLALPDVPLGLWVLLSALRLLISRLPFLPGKDLLFATAVSFLVGQETAVAALIAVTTALMLALHVALGAVLAMTALSDEARP